MFTSLSNTNLPAKLINSITPITVSRSKFNNSPALPFVRISSSHWTSRTQSLRLLQFLPLIFVITEGDFSSDLILLPTLRLHSSNQSKDLAPFMPAKTTEAASRTSLLLHVKVTTLN
ncbi:hypothetical protein Zmor_015412 [Zophobas morio]|uniref:Uncharacterized protein n=1 Tax=Zophobas morio TaxID=2755281 RepID=A0AA38IJ17_9CUCU|nr:hypothetical protein Zmor_015412 [Zophobas morio]